MQCLLEVKQWCPLGSEPSISLLLKIKLGLFDFSTINFFGEVFSISWFFNVKSVLFVKMLLLLGAAPSISNE